MSCKMSTEHESGFFNTLGVRWVGELLVKAFLKKTGASGGVALTAVVCLERRLAFPFRTLKWPVRIRTPSTFQPLVLEGP